MDINALNNFRLNIPSSFIKEHRKWILKNHDEFKDDSNLLDNLSSTNLAPYGIRCRFTQKWHDERVPNDEIFELWMNDMFGFLHIFKAGGSTIQQILTKLTEMLIIPDPQELYKKYFYRNINEENAEIKSHFVNMGPGQFKRLFEGKRGNHYVKRIKHIYITHNVDVNKYIMEWKLYRLSKLFLFSYIRDPLSRFLSGFYEMKLRWNNEVITNEFNFFNYTVFLEENKLHENDTGIQNIEWILSQMKSINIQENDGKIINQEKYYWNVHLFPQMYFLNDIRWITHPLDYIGFIQNAKKSFLLILDQYIKDFNASILDDQWHVLRNRHSNEYYHSHFKRYDINTTQLRDEQIRKICELYWMDYICLPFDIPKQCDLKYLFDTFYGEDKYVVYDYNFSNYLSLYQHSH